MKRMSLIFLAAFMILGVFSACVQESKPIEYDLEAISAQIEESGAFSDILSPVDMGIAADFYGFDPEDIAECRVLFSTGATTEEIGLFKCVSEEAASRVEDFAKARVASQRTAYESYAPGEMPKLDDAIVNKNGAYVFYIVSADANKVEAVLKGGNS